jgi:DNA sulfur modification protein DndD
MILEHLTLRNFCLYRGEQTFDLAPVPAPRGGGMRPIVLFGGTNGAGNTTLLDAIQLALYGTRARCSKRTNLGYDEFLRQSIHHGVPGSEGAAVAVSFRHASGGEEHVYEVNRSWTAQGKKVREELQVSLDGRPDRWHSNHWGQLVEDFFLLEVSQLFFFDAEKIRSLAEDETSSQVLGTAVKSLLGLDLAERLIADAAVLEARATAASEGEPSRDDRGELEREVERLRAEVAAMKTARGEHENLVLRARADSERLGAEFRAAGGRHWEASGDRKRRIEGLTKEIGECERQLVACAGSELPLGLVGDLLERVESQDEREQQAAEAEVIRRLLAGRDERLVGLLAELEAPPGVVRKVKSHLARDRETRAAEAADVNPRLMLAAGARLSLHHLRGHRLGELRREAESLLERRTHLRRELEEVKRDDSITPEDREIGVVVERLRAANERLGKLKEQAEQLDRAMAERRAELEVRSSRLQKIREREANADSARDDRRRMARIAARTRVVMQEFLTRATERKIERLSDLITDSFRFLLRKQSLVERIHIDPATFAITLDNQAGHPLPKERLSEGEKQIFAIAVLWGLARASAHPLPAIIDTPMARLDAAHRRHLIERYFPNASHQVLILSTDTEVDRHYYQALRPYIARLSPAIRRGVACDSRRGGILLGRGGRDRVEGPGMRSRPPSRDREGAVEQPTPSHRSLTVAARQRRPCATRGMADRVRSGMGDPA